MLRKHPYIFATILATISAVVVWRLVPKEYAAITKVSDEYKETDIAIGLDNLTAAIKKNIGSDNENMNDVEVYCKTLKTIDFARVIAQKQVPRKHETYGQWVMAKRYFWQTQDTLQAVCDNIEYNVSSKQETLTIQVTDRDALVAAQMLDSVTAHLQEIVTMTRYSSAVTALKNLTRQRQQEAEEYHFAQQRYAVFCDTHRGAVREEALQEKNSLKNDVSQKYEQYKNTTNQYARELALSQRDYCSFAVVKSNVVPIEDTSHLFVYIFTFVFFALTGVKACRLWRQRVRDHSKIEYGGVFSPWSITLLIWGGMGFMFLISENLLDPLQDQFYIAISLWISILVITSFVTFNLLKHDSRPLPTDGIEINKSVFYFFFFLAIVLSPMYMYKVYQTVAMFDSKDMMKNMRELAVSGEGQGILNYAIVISQSILLVSFWRYPKMPLWQVIVVVSCCIISSLAIMEKGGVFLTLLCGMYVLFERRVIRLRTIFLVGCIALFGFYMFNIMREGEDSTYARNESLLDFIGMYVMSPPVAFCTTHQDITNQPGVNTFEVVYDYLQRFGLGNYDIHEKLQEFVFVPISTNVYTVMQPFYRDFGYCGVAFFSGIYGLVSGIIYRFSRNGNPFFICVYTYIVELLVLQFYQDSLFLSLSFNIQLSVIVVCCTYTISKVSLLGKK